MSDTIDTQSNGLQTSAAAKILWFEFILQPKLLDSHLSSKSSPQPFELIQQLLTNALIISTPSLPPLPPNTNGTTDETNGLSSALLQQQTVDSIKKAMDNKKSTAIKHLSFKIMSHMNWDLTQLETNLPPTQQDFLLSELIRYCDQYKSPTGCKLFACILYYRWILRYIIKSSYPTKPPKGPLIPPTLQQQIDPCFVSNEALDLLLKKLMEQHLIAVTDLERVIAEKQKGSKVEIMMPSFYCFTNSPDSEIVCDWTECVKMATNDVMDDILYDIGRWFFFREEYLKSNTYFESISMSKRNLYNNLNEFLTSTRELISDQKHQIIDVEVIDFEKQAKDSIEQIMNGHTSDISIFESLVDINEIRKIIEKAFKNSLDAKQRNRLLRLTKYLSNKIKNLDEELNKSAIFAILDNKSTEIVLDSSDSEMYEEGEIDGDDDPSLKDPELLLLEATDPEVIQSLVCKTQKHPLMINSKWSLPSTQSKHLQNLSQNQYNKCHIILAKANQLRTANLFTESRVLYLSLLEDIQLSLPDLAKAINYELLRTDLEKHFNTTDVDERQINNLMGKCIQTLRQMDQMNLAMDWPELTELCCVFLLESFPQKLFHKDFYNTSVPIIKFCSALSWLAFDSNTNPNVAKDFWEMIVNLFVSVSNKKGPALLGAPPLVFANSFVSFMSQFKDTTIIALIISCLSKVLNLIRDNSSQELSIAPQFSALWPSSLSSTLSSTLDINTVSSTLNKLLDDFLNRKPNEIILLKCRAELCLIDGQYGDSIKYFTLVLMIKTQFFTCFSDAYVEEESIIQRMIQCCVRLCCHTQAALLHQLSREPNYALAFKALSERNCNDSCDDLYDCIWDTTLLEFLINLHHRRGEIERKTKAIQLIGQLELNANNSELVLREAADVRRGRLMRIFARTYL